jgi:enoyl-CoA hydratase/carnithine racemase
MKIEEFEDILYEKEENGICTITFNRPKRRNALSHVTFLEIRTALDDMEKDKNAKILIMTGSKEGRAFSSGGYFNMKMMTEIPQHILDEIDLLDVAQKETCMKLWNFQKPVIAAINGLAIGAGITMPLAGADLIYMADDPEAYLRFNFAERAIMPEYGLSFILPMYVGFQKAAEILYFTEKITPREAIELGLINKILPPDELLPFTREQALKLIPPKAASLSISRIKQTMRFNFADIISDTLDLENEGLRALMKTSDFRASTKSLITKKPPIFKGR